jgi:hypothetical protein
MAIGGWIGGVGRRSQERALANARVASAVLSRARVEREEVDHYLRTRPTRPVRPGGAVRPA